MSRRIFKNLSFIVVLILTIFSTCLLGDINTINAVTPTTVYTGLRSNVTEVLPGEDVEITFSIHNLASLPAVENGVNVIILYVYYESTKFELPVDKTEIGESIVSDSVKTLGPQFAYDRLYLEDIIIKFKVDNPDYLIIEIPYDYSARKPLNTDGDMFSVRFKAKESVSGETDFYMLRDDVYKYGYVTTATNAVNTPLDNSLARTSVTITGAPISEYTISFNSNGGTSVDSINAVYGDTVAAPDNPTREGYIFKGWYNGTTIYEFTTMPNSNITLNAKWEEVKYTIKYSSNGGLGSVTSQEATYDEAISLNPNSYTRDGYNFIGWSTTASGTVEYTNHQSVSNLRSTSGEVMLYAVWEKIAYTLLINSPYLNITRNGTELKNGAKVYVNDLLIITYSRLGYSDASILVNDIEVTNGEYTVSTGDTSISLGDEVLTDYSITYNLNDGINNTNNPNTFTIITPTITLKDPTKVGYVFDGWYTQATDGSKIVYINNGSSSDVVLYARFKAVLTITLDNMDGLTPNESFNVAEGDPYGINLPTPIREGHMFAGWYTQESGGVRVTASTIATSSTTVYARWQLKSSKISFNSNGGSSVASITDKYGTIINAITNPTRRGYAFLGWYTDNNKFENLQEFPFTVPDEDLVLYAKWEIIDYIISFNSNGGSSVLDIVANYNVTITAPSNPTREGYKFIGWYTDDISFLNKYDFSKMPDNDLILYAKWEKIYTVVFDYQGSDEHVKEIFVVNNSTIGTLPEPIRLGYNFLGWFKEASSVGVKVDSNTVYNFGSDIVLYAKWEAREYYISFNSNGGTPVSIITQFYNGIIVEPNTPTKTGYIFKGWYTDNNTFINLYSFPETMPAVNVSLFAKWEIRNDINITFDINGGTPISPLSNLTYQSNLTLPTPVRSGYKFVAWYSDESLTTTFTLKTVPANDVVLYAKWVEEYVISFEANNSSTINQITRFENDTYGTLPIPTKVGYNFKGWYTTVGFQSGTQVLSSTKVIESLTLYAYWEAETYNIRYNTNGGSIISDGSYNYGDIITAPTAPTKLGYVFSGWYTTTTGTVEFIFNTMPAKDVDVYAKWTREDLVLYVIKLHNYDNANGSINLNRYGTDTYSFPSYSSYGYYIEGWYSSSDFSESSRIIASDVVNESSPLELYANWQIQQVNLSLYSDGKLYLMISQKYNTTITEPLSPVLTGHTFLGWYLSNDGGKTLTSMYVFDTMPGEDLIVYAKWDISNYSITFDSNGGSAVDTIIRKFGSSIVLSTPYKLGYKFLGWYDQDDNKVTSPYIVEEDIILIAKWEIEGFDDTTLDRIIIKSIDGEVIKTINYITKAMLVYVPNQYEIIDIFANALFSITSIDLISRNNLIVGEEVVVEITLIAQSGKIEKYTLTIIQDTEAKLTDIKLNNNLDLVFDGSNEYTVESPIDVVNVLVKAVVNDSLNKVIINGQAQSLINLEASRNISLNAAGSSTVIKIIIESLSGEVSNEYIVTINRSSLSNDARLTNLEIFGNNSLKNDFYQGSTDLLGFNINVENYYMTVTFKDTALIINPTYAIGAKSVVTGNNNLVVGTNIVTITVTALDGMTTKTYIVTVTKEAPSSIAKIDEVRLKNIDTNKIEYNTLVVLGIINVINVPYNYKKISFIPIKSDDSYNASISDLGNLDLIEGINDFVITIIAEDGVTTKDYNIRIIRTNGNTGNTLSRLNINGLDLSPTIDLGNIFNYSLLNKLSYTSVNLLIEADKVSSEFGYVTIKYGTQSAIRTNSLIINPSVGLSTIEIKVYPEKGEVTTYLISLEKENISGNYELSSLLVMDNEDNYLILNPDFNMFILDYDLGSLAYSINRLKIIVNSVIGSSVTLVSVNGVNVVGVGSEYLIDLDEGNNVIIIRVTSNENSSLLKQYKIVVDREAGEDINTAIINSSVGTITSSGNIYNLLLPKNSTGFILNVISNSTKSIVFIDGDEVKNKYFNFSTLNKASYTVEVISEIGNINRYTINVERSNLSNNADLKSIVVTGTKSNQKFTLSKFPASLTIPFMDSSVTFNPSFMEIGSTISTTAANLKVGMNTVVVTVTAEDGITYQNYILNITRETPTDYANLENIIINNSLDRVIQYSLNEVFSNVNYNYSSNVGFNVKGVIINLVISPGFGITYVIKDADGNIVSNNVILVEGENNFIIEVTSEANTTKLYYLEITREVGDSDTSLEYLDITDKDLNYDSSVLVYPSVGYFEYGVNYDFIYISAKTTSNTSKITMQIGSDVINLTDEISYRVDLISGINVVRLMVISENGDEVSYRINVRKGKTSSELDIYDILISGINNKGEEVELLNLYDSMGNLVTFNANNSYYYTTVAFNYKKILIKPQVIKSVVSSNTITIDVIPGNVESVNFIVTAEDGNKSNTYTVYVKGDFGDDDTSLDSLKILDSNGKNYISDFDSNNYFYNISISKSIEFLSAIVDASSLKSTIIVGDKDKNPYDPDSINVETEKDIYIWVIAENGDIKSYIIRVSKLAKSDIAYLESINIIDNKGNDLTSELIPVFKHNNFVYQLVVKYEVSELFITGVGMDGAEIISGNYFTNLQILPFTNVAEVVVEAVDGTTKTYTFLIFRLLPKQDARLSLIELIETDLAEEFIQISDDIFDYYIEVPFSYDFLKFKLFAKTTIDKILINSNMYSEASIYDATLDSGLNVITINVIAEDGVTILTYTLHVDRLEPSREALIKEIVVDAESARFMEKLPNGKYTETTFDPLLNIQYIFVKSDQANIVIKTILSKNSKLKGQDNNELETGLDIGYNIVVMTIVAEDGITENNYFIVINREVYSSNTKIKEILVDNNGFDLKQVSTNLYKMMCNKNTNVLDMSIVLEDKNATYQVIGNENLKDSGIITILVTAEDGNTISTYYITVEQPSSNLGLIITAISVEVLMITAIIILSIKVYKNRDMRRNYY